MRKPARSSYAHSAGHVAEQMAVFWYRALGYRCLGRNVRISGVEVDALMQKAKILPTSAPLPYVLLEVKFRAHGATSATLISSTQQQRLARAAACVAAKTSGNARVDVVLVQKNWPWIRREIDVLNAL